MIKKIDHVGIAVKDVNATVSLFEEILGARLIRKKTFEDQKLISALISIGDDQMELMQSMAEDGVISKFIKARGEGIHHVSLEIDDLEAILNRLQAKGIKVMGVAKSAQPKLFFIHPQNTFGVLIELIER